MLQVIHRGVCLVKWLQKHYLSFLHIVAQDSVALERTAGNALQLMAEVVYSPSFLDFRPSLVAAGVLTSSRKAAGVWPFWPSSLAQLTGPPSNFPSSVFLWQNLHKSVALRTQACGLSGPPPSPS